jgi:hypothetical protein
MHTPADAVSPLQSLGGAAAPKRPHLPPDYPAPIARPDYERKPPNHSSDQDEEDLAFRRADRIGMIKSLLIVIALPLLAVALVVILAVVLWGSTGASQGGVPRTPPQPSQAGPQPPSHPNQPPSELPQTGRRRESVANKTAPGNSNESSSSSDSSSESTHPPTSTRTNTRHGTQTATRSSNPTNQANGNSQSPPVGNPRAEAERPSKNKDLLKVENVKERGRCQHHKGTDY